jgi:hypothetical protein
LLPLEIETPRSPARESAGRGDVPFDRFWAAYPRRRDKDDARRAWDKLIKGTKRNPEKVPAPVLIAAATHYRDSREVADGYAKYPATFLNKGTWRDYALGVPDEPPPGTAVALNGTPARGTDAKIARHLASRPAPDDDTPERDPWTSPKPTT